MTFPMGDIKNKEKHEKRRGFKNKFPSKAIVETRINNIVDSMSLSAADKRKLKTIFTGVGKTPGLIDALFVLDR